MSRPVRQRQVLLSWLVRDVPYCSAPGPPLAMYFGFSGLELGGSACIVVFGTWGARGVSGITPGS